MARRITVKRSHSSRFSEFEDRDESRFFQSDCMDNTLKGTTSQRRIHGGVLHKRCRLSWRPRHVELVSDPTDLSGKAYCFHLHIYDQHKRVLKDKIRVEDIVTIRASRDCYFQLFLTSGKIVQFRATSMESQAHWMAVIKMGLGKGCIFHVRLSTTNNLDHAMLYSISVNLPSHRADQLDRVLVIASPINEINHHAWDLNRVKRFIELDIGIRMELCHSCYRGRSMNITFIMEKQFVKDCVDFLCKEAQIIGPPKVENGLFIYNVDHKCSYNKVKLRAEVKMGEGPKEEVAPPIPPRPPRRCNSESGMSTKSSDRTGSEFRVQINNSNDIKSSDNVRLSHCFTTTSVDVTFNREQPGQSKSFKPAVTIPEHWDDYTGSDSWTGDTGMESLFLSDGLLSSKTKNPPSSDGDSQSLPPRTIPRKDHQSSIPAEEHPYYNFQPHLFNHHGNKSFDAPYQISSRIIIKDSGEVQFERNVMGNRPNKRHGGFHFKGGIPIPPRGLRANTDLTGTASTSNGTDSASNGSGNPSWQTNLNFQSNTETQLSGPGLAQVSHKVNTSFDFDAPPIPPRPQKNSSSGFQSTQTSFKSPVPLPRTTYGSIVKKTSAQSEPTFMSSESESEGLRGDEQALASPFRKLRSDSESELERYFFKNRRQKFGETNSILLNRASVVSDSSELPLPVIPGPPSPFSRSDTRGTLSPSYVDEAQFILETSSPYYLKLVDINEDEDLPGAKREEETSSSVNIADSAIGMDYDDVELVSKKESSSPLSSSFEEHEDKEADFEDAESIAHIQSTFRQRCASYISQDSTQSQISSQTVLESQCMQLLGMDSVPQVPPRSSRTSQDSTHAQPSSQTSVLETQYMQVLAMDNVPQLPPRNIKRANYGQNGLSGNNSDVCCFMSTSQEIRVICGDSMNMHCTSTSMTQHNFEQGDQQTSNFKEEQGEGNREEKNVFDQPRTSFEHFLPTKGQEVTPPVPPRNLPRKTSTQNGQTNPPENCSSSSVHVCAETNHDVEPICSTSSQDPDFCQSLPESTGWPDTDSPQAELKRFMEGEELTPPIPPRNLPRKTSGQNGQTKLENGSPSRVCIETCLEVAATCSSSGTSTCTSSTSSSPDFSQSLPESTDSLDKSGNAKGVVKYKPVPRPRKRRLGVTDSVSSSDSNLLESVNEAERKLSIKERPMSSSLCTRFFLDESGIGVSDL